VNLSLLLSFVAVTFLLVITPGATTAVVIRSAITGGGRAGVATAAGAALGNATHAAAAGLGLTLVPQRLPTLLFAIRLAGAFLPATAGPAAFAVLAGIHVTMAFAVHVGWAFAVARLRAIVTRRPARRALDTGAGVALLLLAAWTVVSLL